MEERNDDISSPPLRRGILSSTLADLHKCGSSSDGAGSIAGFGSKSALMDKATRESAVCTSPLSAYRGIISTALRNENLTCENGCYLPSRREQQTSASIGTSFKSLSKKATSINDLKSAATSSDINCPTLRSARCFGAGQGNGSEWFQERAESTSDFSSGREVADALASPRTGMLGLLLKKKTEFQHVENDKSTNSLSCNLDLTTNERGKEPRILISGNQEGSGHKHLSLGDLRGVSIAPSETSSQSILSKIDDSREDRKEDLVKRSIQYSTSKESKSSSTSVRLLIDNDECEGKSVSYKLLLHAMKHEWLNVEQILDSEESLDLTIADPLGFTALFHSVKGCNASILNKLLSRGALFSTTTKDGRMIAHIAAFYANEGMIRHLLSCKIDFKALETKFNQTPLHFACNRSSKRGFRVTQILLKQWEEGRLAEDLYKCLPIQYAVQCGNIDTVKLLLEMDYSNQLMHVDASGDSLLHVACRSGNNDMLQLLASYNEIDVNIANSAGWTVLHEAALKGNVALLRTLHKLGANANVSDKEDRTPLHVAAAAGHTNIAELLIEKFGGSVRARTRDGSTLLHIAASSGHSSTALTFLKHGVPLYMPNKRGALGLHSAAAAGFEDVVQLLIIRGTSVDIKTKDNYTALHVAVRAGKPSVVEALLGYGADVHLRGGEIGETALHIAAALTTEDAIECTAMLLKSGAQVNVTRNDGETPLHIAARNPLSGMMRLLLSEGCDPKICSDVSKN
ncbi:unnamed protein product [Litomosoides sigmodontis]|uniref:Uncharacterized protein n=1 Tax=Litomosoides sigmodontis TaxID=42156 RepID=A0A3P6TUS8_LITSI|nr:unnamed protein product [Litomosoides sigmodontis]